MTLRDDYELILEGAPQHELDLARDLLEAAGIPCLHERANSSTAALDILGIRPVPFGDLYVPKPARAQAIAVLDQAWGADWKERK